MMDARSSPPPHPEPSDDSDHEAHHRRRDGDTCEEQKSRSQPLALNSDDREDAPRVVFPFKELLDAVEAGALLEEDVFSRSNSVCSCVDEVLDRLLVAV